MLISIRIFDTVIVRSSIEHYGMLIHNSLFKSSSLAGLIIN